MADADVVVHFAAESHVDRSIVGPRSSCGRTWSEPRSSRFGRRARGGTVPARLDRRGLRLHRRGQFQRETAASPARRTPPRRPPATCSPRLPPHPWLPGLLTRSSNNYGPDQFPEKVVPLFVTNLMDGVQVPLYGEGAKVRDWLHVDDHCRACSSCSPAAAPARSTTRRRYRADQRGIDPQAASATGPDWDRVTPVADRLGHDQRYSVDRSKIPHRARLPTPRSPSTRALRRSSGTGRTAIGGSCSRQGRSCSELTPVPSYAGRIPSSWVAASVGGGSVLGGEPRSQGGAVAADGGPVDGDRGGRAGGCRGHARARGPRSTGS